MSSPARARSAVALDDLELAAGGVEPLLELLGAGDALALGLPPRAVLGGLLLELAELLLELLEPLLRGRVNFLLERLAFDLELDDAAVELVELLGLRIDLHALAAPRLVDQVDRLVGQEAVGDVAVGHRRRGDDG